ncbi:MAG: hypothetical protein KC912_13595 [Proteobacteria bacterium]|nr:hypothetical protein [Pseudomonadota bacterium]
MSSILLLCLLGTGFAAPANPTETVDVAALELDLSEGSKGKRRRAAHALARHHLDQGEALQAARALGTVDRHRSLALIDAEARAGLVETSRAAREVTDGPRVFASCEAAEALGELPLSMQFDRGWAHLMNGDIAKATTDLEVAYAGLPAEDRPFVAALVSEVRRDGEPHVALDFATQGVELEPGAFETDLHLLRGLAAWEAGELDVARDELAWLHAGRPTFTHAVWLGSVELERDQLDDAYALFEQAIRLDGQRTEGWLGLAIAAERRAKEAGGDSSEVEGALRRAAQLAPYDAAVLVELHRVLIEAGKPKEAAAIQSRVDLLKTP